MVRTHAHTPYMGDTMVWRYTMRTITIIAILANNPAFVVGCLLWMVVGIIATVLTVGSGVVFSLGVMLPLILLGVAGMVEEGLK